MGGVGGKVEEEEQHTSKEKGGEGEILKTWAACLGKVAPLGLVDGITNTLQPLGFDDTKKQITRLIEKKRKSDNVIRRVGSVNA